MTEDSPGARKIELHSSEREASIRPSVSFLDSFVEVFKHFWANGLHIMGFVRPYTVAEVKIVRRVSISGKSQPNPVDFFSDPRRSGVFLRWS